MKKRPVNNWPLMLMIAALALVSISSSAMATCSAIMSGDGGDGDWTVNSEKGITEPVPIGLEDTEWIWLGDIYVVGSHQFTRIFEIPGTPTSGTIHIACDDYYYNLVLNNAYLGENRNVDGWRTADVYDVTPYLQPGINTLSVIAENDVWNWGGLSYKLDLCWNDLPIAADDDYATDEDTVLSILAPGVLSNDMDPEGDELSVASFDATSANGGTVVMNPDGSFVFTPAPGTCGYDSFNYVVSDGYAECEEPATVYIDVNCCPLADDDEYGAEYGKLLVVAADDGVLQNDDNRNGDDLNAELLTGPSKGTLNLNADGSFSYRPASGFLGIDSFTYKASDGKCYSDPATVTISVAKCPWFIRNELYSALCGEDKFAGATKGILANDPGAIAVLNPETIAVDPAYGSIDVEEDGSFVYYAAEDIPSGTYVQFTYTATNGVCEAKYQGIAKIQISCAC